MQLPVTLSYETANTDNARGSIGATVSDMYWTQTGFGTSDMPSAVCFIYYSKFLASERRIPDTLQTRD